MFIGMAISLVARRWGGAGSGGAAGDRLVLETITDALLMEDGTSVLLMETN